MLTSYKNNINPLKPHYRLVLAGYLFTDPCFCNAAPLLGIPKKNKLFLWLTLPIMLCYNIS